MRCYQGAGARVHMHSLGLETTRMRETAISSDRTLVHSYHWYNIPVPTTPWKH